MRALCFLFTALLCGSFHTVWAGEFQVDPGCETYGAWVNQTNPRTDTTGLQNGNFPEGSDSTYWGTRLVAPLGSVATVHGRYPRGRFISFQIYTSDVLVDFLSDTEIQPDPGENNPFVSGTEQGTFTAHLVFGPEPAQPAPNTLYTGTLTNVLMTYRLYHSTNPDDPAGDSFDPVLPDLWLEGEYLSSCPVRPIIEPEDLTVWGRLDNADFIGSAPSDAARLLARPSPRWTIQDPFSAHFFPNGDNYYLAVLLSREFLRPNTNNDLFVVRFKTPTFPKTRSGEAVYLDREVRFWSLCTDDPYTTNVNRCIPDSDAILNEYGFATFVISDPGGKPTDAALSGFDAQWLPWGALEQVDDVVYDRRERPWGTDTPVHYYNTLIYRQTKANPSFARSIVNILEYPWYERRQRMGAYWPVSGYCSTADFETFGVGCIWQ